MNQELLRIVDGIARDKNIDKETVFEDLEEAMISAIRKANPDEEDIKVSMDRQTGEIEAIVAGMPMSVQKLGRIAAQTAKQVMIQRIREAERGSIYEEYLDRKGEIITGKTARWEGGSMIVDLGRVEAYLPRGEQIPGESYLSDQRIRAMVLDAREEPGAVKIILSRTHPDFIRALFELEVPEVGEGIIEIRGLAREAGYRTKVAVTSLDSKVDPVGACVGIRGSRIKSIVEELGGEKIDIVRWNESSKIFIAFALKPAEVAEIALCFELGRATVVVTEDQLSLAIGKRGQNVRLAARLTGWDIEILTPDEFNAALDILEKALREVEGVDSIVVDQIMAIGMVSVLDVEEVGTEPLTKELELDAELAGRILTKCVETAKRIAVEQAEAKKVAAEQAEAKKVADAEKAADAKKAAEAQADSPEDGDTPAESKPADEGEPASESKPADDGEPGEAEESTGEAEPASESEPADEKGESVSPAPVPEPEPELEKPSDDESSDVEIEADLVAPTEESDAQTETVPDEQADTTETKDQDQA